MFYAVTLHASILGVSVSPAHEAICGIPLLQSSLSWSVLPLLLTDAACYL